jgi:asparagine synthase (glutamine-hydrolysing)
MCGIAGIVDLNGKHPPNTDELKLMAGIMRHRGPDEAGVYLDNRTGLAHVRLSIIDLSGGTQPLDNEDGSLWISFNGEIFNYPELREEMEQKGHRFKTRSDTETILHMYEEYGLDCFNHFNGQFALAIRDTRTNRVVLARDRVGIRPLYYTRHNGRLLFASEIKALFALPQLDRAFDPVAFDELFNFWTTLPGRTVFENVHELPPGNIMVIGEGEPVIKPYWQLTFPADGEYDPRSFDEIREEAAELLTDAVRVRLRADVPVGTYLSGGLDSSGVTALVKKKFNNRLRTFGIRFEESEFDEGEFQQMMVQALGTEHEEIRAGNRDIALNFRDVLWHSEKPLLRTSPVPLYLLSEKVNQSGFKVVLTGEGADEIFTGYNIFKETKVRQFWARQPQSRWRPLLLARLYPYILKDERLKNTLGSFFGGGLDQPDNPFFSHAIRWRNTARIKGLFSRGLRDTLGDYDSSFHLRRLLPPEFDSWPAVTKAQYLEVMIFLSNYLLSSQGDRVAMAHSLEIRLPYLDFRLIEFMARVDPRMKMNVLNEKYLLKKILEPYLPPQISRRPKHPYRAPTRRSFFDYDRETVMEICSPQRISDAGIFDPARVAHLLGKVERSARTSEFDSMALTGVYSSQLIYEQFIRDFPREAIPALAINKFIDKRGEYS